MNRLRRSSINMIAGAAGYIVPMLVNFISTPLLLHAMGEEAFGLQSLVNVLIGYFTMMEMGMDLPIIKYLAEDHARSDAEMENRLLNTTFQLYGTIGVAGMFVIMLGAEMFALRVFSVPSELVGQAVDVFWLAGVGFLASVLALWGRAVMIGLQRLDISNSVAVITNVSGVGSGLIAVYTGYGVVGYVFCRVASSLISAVIYFPIVRRMLPGFRLYWGLDMAMLRRIGSYVRYGVLNRLLGMVTTGLDRTLIGIWLGMAAVTLYAIPFFVSSSIIYLINSMLHFIFPMASELYSTNRIEELRAIFIRATRFVAALATVIFVLLWVLSDRFLTLWVGPDVATQSSEVFRLLLVATYLGTLSVVLVNQVMPGTGHIREFTIYSLTRALVFSAGCFLLIRPFGITGAGMALVLTAVIDVVFCLVTLRCYLNISLAAIFQAAYLRPLLLGVVLGGVAFLARPLATLWVGLGVVGTGLGLFYILIGYHMGMFGETEKRAVIELWQIAAQQMKRVEGKT